jgi:uncharacterized protein with NRDE domain
MCTVVFIPHEEKVFFASLRDESPLRQRALTPAITTINSVSFISPKDPVAGGTWIGANDLGNTIILLNGGFDNHRREKYYRKSRGMIVSELLATELPVTEWAITDMKNIEPFTLITWNTKDLFQLTWDGAKKHKIELDAAVPHIWSSATLYNTTAREYRKELFQKWINANPVVSKQTILSFFKTYTDVQNGFIMNRDEKTKTLSYTSLEINHTNAAMSYYDLLENTDHTRSIAHSKTTSNVF